MPMIQLRRLRQIRRLKRRQQQQQQQQIRNQQHSAMRQHQQQHGLMASLLMYILALSIWLKGKLYLNFTAPFNCHYINININIHIIYKQPENRRGAYSGFTRSASTGYIRFIQDVLRLSGYVLMSRVSLNAGSSRLRVIPNNQ